MLHRVLIHIPEYVFSKAVKWITVYTAFHRL